MAQRGADDRHEGQSPRAAHQVAQCRVGGVEQGGLQHQVAAGVGRHGQLGKGDDLDAAPRRLFGEGDDAVGVEIAVGDLYVGHRCGYFQKSELIHSKRGLARSGSRGAVPGPERFIPPRGGRG